jgi:hypothetical protein
MDSQFGQEVGLTEARKYVEAYKALRDTLIEKVLPEAPSTEQGPVQDSIDFHKSEVNAFIFDAELITRFFEGPDPAKYLMVFMGANGVKPTVVTAGAKDGEKPGTFRTFSSKPGNQHPGFRIDATFPGPDSGEMNIKML